MNRLEELDKLQARPVTPPFEHEQDFAQALRQVFDTKLGRQVLQQLKLDMGYYAPDLPSGKDVDAQAHFNNGKRYVINHIDTALTVEYFTPTNEDNDE